MILYGVSFLAPEVVNGDPISVTTDLWSVGVIIYVLLSGVSPFYSDSHERSCQNITEIRYRFPQEFFHGISSEAKDLIEELLIHDQRQVFSCLKTFFLDMLRLDLKCLG